MSSKAKVNRMQELRSDRMLDGIILAVMLVLLVVSGVSALLCRDRVVQRPQPGRCRQGDSVAAGIYAGRL